MKAVHLLFPDFAFMWLVEEAKKNMPLELDFLNEGRNAEKVAKMLSHYTFLKVNWSHSERDLCSYSKDFISTRNILQMVLIVFDSSLLL